MKKSYAMSASEASSSEQIRSKLDHPVVDCDGHYIEFMPYYMDFVHGIGGTSLVETFKKNRIGEIRLRPSAWHNMSKEERQYQLRWRRPFYALPTKLVEDRATSMIPRLLYRRMDELGIDFSILYPTLGLDMVFIKNDELRRAACRALNLMNAKVWEEFSDRMTPVAVIPTTTPEEGIHELDYAIGCLGLKGIMISGNVHRYVPQVEIEAPEWARYAMWYDHMAMDSKYNYDPFWAKCLEHQIAPTAHAGHQGIGSMRSISSYTYNHIGSFNHANHAFCKALFLGGVAKRFPQLRFGFLEGGVGWAVNLIADIMGHWEKRNRNAISNYDPKKLDTDALIRYFHEYGSELILGKENSFPEHLETLKADFEKPGELDEFLACGCENRDGIRDQFRNFYFGCEADDKINALAFQGEQDRHMNAMFSSDISHWDVPDMRECVSEAYELVKQNYLTEDDFQAFMFINPVQLHLSMNPKFFKGTRIELEVDKLKKLQPI